MKYEITSPDGRQFEITAPDDASQEDVLAYAREQFAPRKTTPPRPKPDEGLLTSIAGGAVEPLLHLGSGAVAGPLAGLAGIAGAALPGPPGQGASWAQQVAGLTYQPGTVGGKAATEAITYPLRLLGEGADWAGGGIAEATGSPALGAGVNAALQMAAPLGAARLGRRLSPPKNLVHAPQFMRNIMDPHLGEAGLDRAAGRVANLAAGDNRGKVIDALRAGNAGLTAGQASVPAGSAEFAALQKLVAERLPSKYAAIDDAQAQARRSVLEEIAGTPEELAAAEKYRGAQARDNYGAIENDRVDASDIVGLLGRPSVKKAAPRVGLLGLEQETPTSIVNVLRKMADSPENLRKMADSPENLDVSIGEMHHLKLALDDAIKDPHAFGLMPFEAGAVAKTRGQLRDWLNEDPGYAWAGEEFARDSSPINRMKVGAALRDKLTSALEREQPANFAQAVRNEHRTVKTSLGDPRFGSLDDAIGADNAARVREVAADLTANAAYKDLAARGMPAARERIGQVQPLVPPTGMFSPAISVTRGVINRAQGMATTQILDHLAKKMDDPKAVARLMAGLPTRERQWVATAIRTRNPTLIGAMVAAGEEDQR